MRFHNVHKDSRDDLCCGCSSFTLFSEFFSVIFLLCSFSLHKAVKSAVPQAATELSVSCAAHARTEEFATTSLESVPVLLDGRCVLCSCSFRGRNRKLVVHCLRRSLPYVLVMCTSYKALTILELGPPLLHVHNTYIDRPPL